MNEEGLRFLLISAEDDIDADEAMTKFEILEMLAAELGFDLVSQYE